MDAKAAVHALEYLAEVTRQLISLSTGLLAFTVTFLPQISRAAVDVKHVPQALRRMWLSHGISVGFGLVCLLIVTGQLGRNRVDVYAANLRVAFFLQLLAFGVGAVYLWRVGSAMLASLLSQHRTSASVKPEPSDEASEAGEAEETADA